MRILLLLGLVACGFEDSDIPVETPPLKLGSGTTPADSTEQLFDADGIDLVVAFNRAMDAGEVTHLELVPTPAAFGPVLNPAANPRQIEIRSAVLDTVFPVYRLVVDGPTMPGPAVLSYYSRSHSALEGAIQGGVGIERGDGRARDALVYALVPPGTEADFPLSGNEGTILGRPIVGVTRAFAVVGVEGAWYRLAGLQLFREYMVLAILDTNADGEYDPDEDWWGYFRDALGTPVEVHSGVAFGSVLDPPLPELRTDVDFSILPPGSLDPGLGP